MKGARTAQGRNAERRNVKRQNVERRTASEKGTVAVSQSAHLHAC